MESGCLQGVTPVAHKKWSRQEISTGINIKLCLKGLANHRLSCQSALVEYRSDWYPCVKREKTLTGPHWHWCAVRQKSWTYNTYTQTHYKRQETKSWAQFHQILTSRWQQFETVIRLLRKLSFSGACLIVNNCWNRYKEGEIILSLYTSLFIVEILSTFRYLGMTFINRERIVLLESKFHFQIECCIVPTVALFQIRSADWFVIDIRQMFTCK